MIESTKARATPAPDDVIAESSRRYYVEYYDAWGELLGAEYVRLLKPFNVKEGRGFSGGAAYVEENITDYLKHVLSEVGEGE